MLPLAETASLTALPTPAWQHAPTLAHAQVDAVRVAGLEPGGQG